MLKIKNLAFLSALLSCTFTLNSYADNCTVTAPVTNVNLNYVQTGRVSANFNNCKIRVRPSFQWSNPAGKSSVFRLDGKPDVYIPVSLYSQIGGEWDGNPTVKSILMTAQNASADFNNNFPNSSQTKNLTAFAALSLYDFVNLAQYPPGTYRASLTFSAVEW